MRAVRVNRNTLSELLTYSAQAIAAPGLPVPSERKRPGGRREAISSATGVTVGLTMVKKSASKLRTRGIPELKAMLDLARDASAAGRNALFATVKDLFFESEGVLSERERVLMGDILDNLIGDVEKAVRKELAERLAGRRDAPRKLVVALAKDEIEVAHDLLRSSTVLQDVDLIEIIRHRTQAHQLAVAMRKKVSEEVSQALADTGDDDVITTLLKNDDAAISRGLMAHLVAESKRIDRFQMPLIKRRDLPPDLARKMYWWVSAALRHHIVENFDVDPTVIDDSVEVAVKGALERDDVGSDRPTEAERFADQMAERDRLTEDFMVQILRQGEVSLFEACFAKATDLDLKLARRLLYQPGGEGIAFACKAAGFKPATFADIFQLTRKGLAAKEPFDPRQVSQATEFFDRLKQDHAIAVIKRYRRDANYLHALDKIEERQPRTAKSGA